MSRARISARQRFNERGDTQAASDTYKLRPKQHNLRPEMVAIPHVARWRTTDRMLSGPRCLGAVGRVCFAY